MTGVSIESLALVASKLQTLQERFAFVGGAVLPLLLDDVAVANVRPARDVDVIACA